MTKLIFRQWIFAIIAVVGFINIGNAQDIRLGAHVGLPAGDASDISSVNIGADASFYFFEVTDWLNLGVSTGYTHFIGKTEDVGGFDIEYDDFGYIPIAVSGRGVFGEKFFYTADIGYAIGMNDADGGLYYQGKFGWTNAKIDAYLFYKGVSDEFDVSVLGLGVAFKVF